MLRPYWHVLQRGGRRAPTHHTVTSCHSTLRLPLRGDHGHVPGPLRYHITLGVKVLSLHFPAPDAPNCADNVLRTRLTVLQLERSSANVALAFLQ